MFTIFILSNAFSIQLAIKVYWWIINLCFTSCPSTLYCWALIQTRVTAAHTYTKCTCHAQRNLLQWLPLTYTMKQTPEASSYSICPFIFACCEFVFVTAPPWFIMSQLTMKCSTGGWDIALHLSSQKQVRDYYSVFESVEYIFYQGRTLDN